MPRNKSESHQRIIEAARSEFLTYGFAEASMRRIASSAGITVSGLYKHFASKEEMFASLVDPVIETFYRMYHEKEAEDFGMIEDPVPGKVWDGSGEAAQFMSFIYDHEQEFVLILMKSEGTRYENFLHELALLEEETTKRYMRQLKEKGIPVRDVDDREFHLLTTAYIEAIFQALMHGFSREEAMHYAATLEYVSLEGWHKLFGI